MRAAAAATAAAASKQQAAAAAAAVPGMRIAEQSATFGLRTIFWCYFFKFLGVFRGVVALGEGS